MSVFFDCEEFGDGAAVAQGRPGSSDRFSARADAGVELSAEELLRVCTDELELKSAVLDGLADGILVHTMDGAILYFNPAAAVVYGCTEDEFAQLGAYGWVPPDVDQPVESRVSTLRETGVLDFQSTGLTAEGGTVATEVHARLVALPGFGEVVVSVIQNVTLRVAAQETMRHLAYHDRLTGLANRVMLDERLRMAMSSADRHGDVVGVVFLDLDAFKPVNDTFGHSAGDRVLRIVGERLMECVREYDTVARLGGDEFLVLFPGSSHVKSSPTSARRSTSASRRRSTSTAGRSGFLPRSALRHTVMTRRQTNSSAEPITRCIGPASAESMAGGNSARRTDDARTRVGRLAGITA